MKKLFIMMFALVALAVSCLSAHAQFSYGQLVTSTSLNAAFAAKAGTVSPSFTSTVSAPFTLNGVQSIIDAGRSNNDNTPSINLNITESLNYTSSYATHYGFILNATELSGGTGDRVGASFIQTCNATLTGKSCVGGSGLAVAGGSGVGNYTGWNLRALVPAGLTGGGGAIPGEADVETHSPVTIRNGFRIAGENLSGGTQTHGSVEDTALPIVVDSGDVNDGFKVGIQFGETAQGYPQNWPILTGGTLFQAYSPTVQLAYGIDWTGSTAGFSKQAIALPQNTAGGGIQWGVNGLGGSITSTATSTGATMVSTDTGWAISSIKTVTHNQQEVDKSYVYTSPANDATLVFPATTETILIDPATALTSLTITLLACNSTNDGLIARFSTTQNITGVTMNTAGGAIANPVTALSAGVGHGYLCASSRAAWYPLY